MSHSLRTKKHSHESNEYKSDVTEHQPATHAVQACPSAPVYPALHVQSESSSLEMSDRVLAGQARHSLLSAALYVSARQSVQVLEDTAAVAAEYLPPVHDVQEKGPMASLNLPAPPNTTTHNNRAQPRQTDMPATMRAHEQYCAPTRTRTPACISIHAGPHEKPRHLQDTTHQRSAAATSIHAPR